MVKETALQKLKNRLEDVFVGNENFTYKLCDIKELIFKEIDLHKPVEREQMEDAFKDGNKTTYASMSEFVSFGAYFNQTYKQEYENKADLEKVDWMKEANNNFWAGFHKNLKEYFKKK